MSKPEVPGTPGRVLPFARTSTTRRRLTVDLVPPSAKPEDSLIPTEASLMDFPTDKSAKGSKSLKACWILEMLFNQTNHKSNYKSKNF